MKLPDHQVMLAIFSSVVGPQQWLRQQISRICLYFPSPAEWSRKLTKHKIPCREWVSLSSWWTVRKLGRSLIRQRAYHRGLATSESGSVCQSNDKVVQPDQLQSNWLQNKSSFSGDQPTISWRVWLWIMCFSLSDYNCYQCQSMGKSADPSAAPLQPGCRG